MLPYNIRSKLGNFKVTVHGVTVSVSVVEESCFLPTKVSHFRSLLSTGLKDRLVVGVDIKSKSGSAKALILCYRSCCVVIRNLRHLNLQDLFGSSCAGSKELKGLLADSAVCFVGMGMKSKLSHLEGNRSKGEICRTGVELSYLAARILNKPNVQNYGSVEELGAEVGMDIKPKSSTAPGGGGTSQEPDWDAEILTEEEIKHAIHDACAYYLIGDKLLGMLA
ncbi:unnamed protein product [Malus baccata var. baccata]